MSYHYQFAAIKYTGPWTSNFIFLHPRKSLKDAQEFYQLIFVRFCSNILATNYRILPHKHSQKNISNFIKIHLLKSQTSYNPLQLLFDLIKAQACPIVYQNIILLLLLNCHSQIPI